MFHKNQMLSEDGPSSDFSELRNFILAKKVIAPLKDNKVKSR